MIIPLSEQEIEDTIMEQDSVASSLASLYRTVVPHYDWANRIKIGSVTVNETTSEKIIGTLVKKFPKKKNTILLFWVNQGFSVRKYLKNWSVEINMDLIDYKEIK